MLNYKLSYAVLVTRSALIGIKLRKGKKVYIAHYPLTPYFFVFWLFILSPSLTLYVYI